MPHWTSSRCGPHDWSTNAAQSSSARPAPIVSIARWTADFLRRLACRQSRCETSLPPALTIRKWQRGWLHKRKRRERTSFAGVDDFRRIRSGGSSKWKIGCTGALAPESKVKNSLQLTRRAHCAHQNGTALRDIHSHERTSQWGAYPSRVWCPASRGNRSSAHSRGERCLRRDVEDCTREIRLRRVRSPPRRNDQRSTASPINKPFPAPTTQCRSTTTSQNAQLSFHLRSFADAL